MDALVAFVCRFVFRAPHCAFAPLLPLAMLLGAPPAGGQSAGVAAARTALPQFKHTRWTADEGAPKGIHDIAQTPDGYLWLASEDGLIRFDGVTFERIPAPPGSSMDQSAAFSLFVRRSGELLITFSPGGGVAAYRRGRLVDLHMPDPPSTIDVMAESADGAVWLATGLRAKTARRLWRFSAGRFEPMADRLKVPEGSISGLAVTPDQTLWVATYNDNGGLLAALVPGDDQFRPSGYRGPGELAVSVEGKGALWVFDASGARSLAHRQGKVLARGPATPTLPGARFRDFGLDSLGGLWVATMTVGVYRHADAGSATVAGVTGLQRFRGPEGLTSDRAHALLIDVEGNIWTGTDAGLDQFRVANVRSEPTISHDPSQDALLARSNDGSVYVLSSEALYLVAPGRPPRAIAPPTMFTICTARAGGIWAVDERRAYRIDGDRKTEVIALPAGTAPTPTCAEGRDGLYLRLITYRLLRHDRSGWKTITEAEDAVRSKTHWDLLPLSSGDVAFYRGTDLVRLGKDAQSSISLAIGNLPPLLKTTATDRDVLVGASRGLIRVRGDQLRTLAGTQYPWLIRSRGLVQDPAGYTWFLTSEGMSRFANADLERAFERPGSPLPRRLFDEREGLSGGIPGSAVSGPQIVVGGDGRVWFRTRQGVASIAPAVHLNPVAPNMAIRSLNVGGTIFRDPAGVTLPSGTRSLEIVYAALSLAVPQRVQFRYRLEGVDDGWIDPGARRTASYSNLGPGKYRFQVIGANNDGVWNRAGATLKFEIPPTFVQSWPFKLLCAMIVLGMLWLAYSLRLRAVANRIRGRMAERIAERERIARDLHDTLLQSVQALTLRFQLVVDELPVEERARPGLEAAIDRADQVIAEGRDRVRNLRVPDQGGDIAQIMAEIVAQQGFDPAVAVSIETVGNARNFDPLALDEIVRIGGEAVFNVRRHARATRIAIEIRFQSNFAICIVDNGVGIAPAVIEQGGKDGHFGVPGMRERARKLDGDLLIRRIPEGGTQVVLTVPGRIAYQKRASRWALRRRWWS